MVQLCGQAVRPWSIRGTNYVVVPVCLPHCAYAGEDERELGRAAARQVEQVSREVQECDLLNAVDSQSFHGGTFGNYHCANQSEPTTAHSSQPTMTCSDLRSRRIASIISTLTCAVQRKQNAKPHPSIRAAHTRTRLNRDSILCITRCCTHLL